MMKILYAILMLAVFSAGIGLGGLVAMMPDAMDVETYSTSSRALTFTPVQTANEDVEPLRPVVSREDLSGPIERDSPGDWIDERQIEMRPDGVFIHFNNPQWAILADTNSMDPVFDTGSHLIQLIPTSSEQIKVGDIVSYSSPLGFSIVHRVIEVGNDEDGWYAILKGDNNPKPDPWKVRFDWVRRVTVMIVY